VGGNKGLGGKNDSDFGFTGTLVNPTVEVDNTTIMKNGKLNILGQSASPTLSDPYYHQMSTDVMGCQCRSIA